MRRFNAILTAAIMLLFLLHAVFGAFQLFGVGGTALKTLAWIDLGLIAVHVIIGVKLTADTLRVWKKTGAPYLRENLRFWAARLSGLAIMVFLAFHLTAFNANLAGVYRLRWFTAGRLAAQLLLAASIAVHVITNVKPMLLSFGIRSLKPWTAQILFVLSVLLLVMAAAFVVYYLRWNVW